MRPQLPSAIVQHALLGRVRFRIMGKRGDNEYFERAERVLAASPVVSAVVGSPLTGSLLVEHQGHVEGVVEYASNEGVFALAHDNTQESGPFTRLDAELERLDHKVRRVSHGKWGTTGLAFYGVLAASAVQLGKGNVFPPAVSLLLYSFDLYLKAREAERVASSKR